MRNGAARPTRPEERRQDKERNRRQRAQQERAIQEERAHLKESELLVVPGEVVLLDQLRELGDLSRTAHIVESSFSSKRRSFSQSVLVILSGSRHVVVITPPLQMTQHPPSAPLDINVRLTRNSRRQFNCLPLATSISAPTLNSAPLNSAPPHLGLKLGARVFISLVLPIVVRHTSLLQQSQPSLAMTRLQGHSDLTGQRVQLIA